MNQILNYANENIFYSTNFHDRLHIFDNQLKTAKIDLLPYFDSYLNSEFFHNSAIRDRQFLNFESTASENLIKEPYQSKDKESKDSPTLKSSELVNSIKSLDQTTIPTIPDKNSPMKTLSIDKKIWKKLDIDHEEIDVKSNSNIEQCMLESIIATPREKKRNDLGTRENYLNEEAEKTIVNHQPEIDYEVVRLQPRLNIIDTESKEKLESVNKYQTSEIHFNKNSLDVSDDIDELDIQSTINYFNSQSEEGAIELEKKSNKNNYNKVLKNKYFYKF